MDDHAIDKALKNAKYLQVLRLVHLGQTIESSCQEVGVSRTAYFEWRDCNPDSLAAFSSLLSEQIHQALDSVLAKRLKIINQLLDDALDPTTKVSERLAVFTKMEKFLGQLVLDARLDGLADSSAADEVLAGPILTPATSRFSIATPPGSKTTITVETPQEPVTVLASDSPKDDDEQQSPIGADLLLLGE